MQYLAISGILGVITGGLIFLNSTTTPFVVGGIFLVLLGLLLFGLALRAVEKATGWRL